MNSQVFAELLEKCVEPRSAVLPTPAEQASRQQLESAAREYYRWARRDRRTSHFQPDAMSGDAAIYESHDLMHRRVRSETVNNSQIKKIVESLTDLIVGTGIQTFSSPFDPWMIDLSAASLEESINLASLSEGLRFALEADDWFEEWYMDPKQFDAAGKLSGADMQRLAMSECVQVGSVLLLRCQRNEPGRITPLCYQIIERDQLDIDKDRPAAPNQNKIVNGVEVDSFGREVAFHIYDAHPHDQFTPFSGTFKSSRVPASRVIHLFMFRRPSQTVGATWMDAVGQNSFDRDKFIGSEIAAAAKAALLTLIAKRENPNTGNLGLEDGEESDSDIYGNEEVRLGSSPIAVEVGIEEDVKMIESVRPNDTANNFVNILDHDAAAGGGVSYYQLTGRFDDTNYTGFRGALLSEDMHIRPLQGWFSRQVVLPIRRQFNLQAAAAGLYSTITPEEFRRETRRYQRFDAISSGRQLLDIKEETEGALAKLRGGLTTLKIECAREGLHWIKVLFQKAIEARVTSAIGLTLDHSKGEGGKVEQKQETKKRDAKAT